MNEINSPFLRRARNSSLNFKVSVNSLESNDFDFGTVSLLTTSLQYTINTLFLIFH